MDQINKALREQLEKVLTAGITDEAIKSLKKQVRDIICNVESDIDYRLKDELAPNLSLYVVEMAKNSITALLEGNEAMMVQYLGCERGTWTGRSDSPEWGRRREPHEWHPVIHGKLFEQGTVRLRAEIVAAHHDLIVSERIRDLEDQVKSLVAQVNKANDEKEQMVQRLRGKTILRAEF